MEINAIKKLENNLNKYYCDFCDFKCFQKCDWERHIIRPKHMFNKDGNKTEIVKLEKNFLCDCGQKFKTNSGLWKHNQKCCIINNSENINEDNEYMYQGINIKDKDALVLHLLKQNGELHNKIIEMASQSSINVNNTNSHNNIQNKTFNLQFFLNDTCKDAMNISEFISSINFNLEDLEHTGRTGYIEGISNIVVNSLNKLEQHMRPLHCSDNKREVLYIKDNNEWTRETEEKPILTKAIKTIANENIKQISKWRQKYPDCTKSDSKKNDLYLKIVSNSMNGLTKEEGEQNINKIISNVAKKVVIDK
jgi:hypothetical protein